MSAWYERIRVGVILGSMTVSGCLFPSQYVIQSASIPTTEAIQPKTIVAISLGLQFEPCSRLSDDMGNEELLQFADMFRVSVLLASILLITCIILCTCGTVLAAFY